MEETLKLRKIIRANLDFSKSYDAIIDNTHLENYFSSKDIGILSNDQLGKNLPPSKVAIIAPTDIAFGMNRMYEMLTEIDNPMQMYVFRDRNEAITWLGRDIAEVEKIIGEIMKEAE